MRVEYFLFGGILCIPLRLDFHMWQCLPKQFMRLKVCDVHSKRGYVRYIPCIFPAEGYKIDIRALSISYFVLGKNLSFTFPQYQIQYTQDRYLCQGACTEAVYFKPRWRSSQSHQTVNLATLSLPRCESWPRHFDSRCESQCTHFVCLKCSQCLH